MFDIKEAGLYDKLVLEMLNFGIKMNDRTDEK
jgi:hypothetical protein